MQGRGDPKKACPEVWGKCKPTSPGLLRACRPFLQHLCSLGEAGDRSGPQSRGQAPVLSCTGLSPDQCSPVSLGGGLPATPESTAKLRRLWVLVSPYRHFLFSVVFSENPGPRSIYRFSAIPQAAPYHSQNGPRTQPFLQ